MLTLDIHDIASDQIMSRFQIKLVWVLYRIAVLGFQPLGDVRPAALLYDLVLDLYHLVFDLYHLVFDLYLFEKVVHSVRDNQTHRSDPRDTWVR